MLIGLTPAVGIGAGLLTTQAAYSMSAEDWFDSGVAKAKRGDWQGAIADWTKVIEINPRFADAYSNRGVAKEELEDYQGAIADYTKAIQINPALRQAYINRGIDLEIVGDPQGACSDWRKAADLGDDDSADAIKKQC